MSKQLKLKFKKILKKAEFVYADLEYHLELFPDAKKKFSEAVNNFIAALGEEEQHMLTSIGNQKIIQQENQIKEAALKRDIKTTNETTDELVGTDQSNEVDVLELEEIKPSELKKLFRKIAAQTHPDKVGARGASVQEIQKLEKIFKKAQKAYAENNWYVLYSMAVKLEMDLSEPSTEHINWIEDSIRNALADIATQNNLLAWIWYVGDEETKNKALRDYFKQVFNFDFPQ